MNRSAGVGIGALLLVGACGEPAGEPEASTTEILTARTAGLTYLQQDRLDEAEAEFARLIRLAPDEASGYASLGLVHLRGGDAAAAESRVREALEIEPDNPEIRLILAKIFEDDGRRAEAIAELQGSLLANPEHPKTLYALAALARGTGEPATPMDEVAYLGRLADRLPGNLAARLQLATALLDGGRADEAIAQLEELRRQAPDFPAVARAQFEAALEAARLGPTDEASRALSGFRAYFEVTPPYQAAIQDLRGPSGALVGIPNLTFSHEFSLRVQAEGAVLDALRFTDATAGAGLDIVTAGARAEPSDEEAPAAVVAIGDVDGDGDHDLYAATRGAGVEGAGFLLRSDLGRFVDVTEAAGLTREGLTRSAAFGDYDGDRRLDLYLVDDEVNTLYHNEGDGLFSDVTGRAGLARGGGNEAAFVDLDLDGDLDLYEARRGANRFYRNNGDGSFTERALGAGLAGRSGSDSRAVAFADFDDDRDLDLFVVNADGPAALFTNERGGAFSDIASEVGLETATDATAAAAGDYDNDGWPDLFVGTARAGESALYRNRGDGTFARDPRSSAALRSLAIEARDAAWLDFDNDGHLDLLVAGRPAADGGTGLALLRNDGTGAFSSAARHLPADLAGGIDQVAVADYNQDGDLDLYLGQTDGTVRLLRNDGANVNHYLKIELVGLGTGSGKNNRFGIGSRIEVRTGDLLQTRVVDGPVTHFGLDGRLKADVVRIEWTNGVAQDLFFPGSDQDLIEDQQLKGSCAFLYTWSGGGYEFVTDVMWRSAIGMPLGIMGGDGGRTYAPPYPSQEYIKIPGDRLTVIDDEYRIQLTEELWETAYLDEVKLVAVDHPASVELWVDERFVPPEPASFRLFRTGRRRPPVAAVDDRGHDQLEMIRTADHRYVSNLVPGRYQGITEMHDLVLDLGDAARGQEVVLYLTGWIFPSDASINVALSQSAELRPVFPYLEVVDGSGRWVRVAELSIPSGKNKTVVADLSGRFPTADRRVRIRTNLEVYWDHIFFETGPPDPTAEEIRTRILTPLAADLHYRGFSRLYRQGGRYGPHWFDYTEVTPGPKWSDLEGLYTRYGDVRPLLLEPDDMYAILNAGDEVTVRFDAGALGSPPSGWTRTFFLYTDGWIKDGDLNTASGQSVEPLPFRDQSRYPYGADESYPADEAHLRYLRTYNTRRVTGGRF